jgi:hypothetical protein
MITYNDTNNLTPCYSSDIPSLHKKTYSTMYLALAAEKKALQTSNKINSHIQLIDKIKDKSVINFTDFTNEKDTNAIKMNDKLTNGMGYDMLQKLINKYKTSPLPGGSGLNITHAVTDVNRDIQNMLDSYNSYNASTIAGKCLQYRTLLEIDKGGRFHHPVIFEKYEEVSNALSFLLDDLQTYYETSILEEMIEPSQIGDNFIVKLPHQVYKKN